jgi:hypothetical protein
MNTDNNTIGTVTETATASATATVDVVKKKAGRPKAEIKFPRGIFTVDSLFAFNKAKDPNGKGVSKLTIRKRIVEEVKNGFLTEVDALKTGKVGQPAAQFIRTAVKEGLEAARATRSHEDGGTTTPVSGPEVSLTETPAEAPVAEVPTEAPAVETPVAEAPAAV